MSEAQRFPYPYGSDLHWLWGWGERLNAWLKDDQPPSQYDWMIFRPDGLASNAMMRFSVGFPHIIKQIDDALDFAESWFARLDEGAAAAETFGGAMFTLRDRIETGVATIEHAQDPIGRLAAMPTDAVLSDDDLAKLRAHLQAPMKLSELQAEPAKRERRRKLQELLNYNEQTRAHGGKRDAEQADWQNVKDRLERLRDQGERYTSQADLAERLSCAQSTIHKAISASPMLKAWMAEARKGKATPRATGLTGVVADDARQSREPDPADALADDEVDAVMAKLIEQAKPEERAKLHELNAEGRRLLVKAYHAHNLDDEPSPLDDDQPGRRARGMKQHKRI